VCVLFVEDEPLILMGTASLARGAVEIVMEALGADVAQKIERKRLHFHNARDGVSHSPKVPLVMGLDSRVVAAWLKAMDEAFAPIKGWLPWS